MTQFPMPVLVMGFQDFTNDEGNRYVKLFSSNESDGEGMHVGNIPSEVSCDFDVIDALPRDSSKYPMQLELMVSTKTQKGKTVFHAHSVKQSKPAK